MITFMVLAICGFIVLTFSLLFGHDADHDGDHHFGEGDGPGVFSTKIISLFVTGFGASGAIAMYYKYSIFAASMFGVFFGLLLGAIGYFLVNLFYSQQADSLVRTAELIGQVGSLSIGIPPKGVGEVVVHYKGQMHYYPAKTKDGSPLDNGGAVKVVENVAGTMFVEPI